MKVYLYRCYNDNNAYGEMDFSIYAKKEDAVERLKKDVEAHFGTTFANLPADLCEENDMSLEVLKEIVLLNYADDCVTVDTGNGYLFFDVDEVDVIGG